MKSITLIILIPLLFLSSCTIDWNGEKDKRIAELEKQVTELKEKNDDALFKKNKECGSYLKKFDDKFSKEGQFGNGIILESSIFYSKNYNTCIYHNSTNDKTNRIYFNIIDALTNEIIYGVSTAINETGETERKKYNEIINKLK